jgi:hypothetical protein
MDQHTKRLAASAYDRGRDLTAHTAERAIYVGVDLGGGVWRTLLGDVKLAGDPPPMLHAAVAATLDVLRVTWIAMLTTSDELERRRLDAAHAAIQCELVATEWAWSTRATDARSLARTLAARRERLRQTLAMPPPAGAGLLVPGCSRANEPLPNEMELALDRVARAAELRPRGGREGLLEMAYALVGAWRLRAIEAGLAATAIGELAVEPSRELEQTSEHPTHSEPAPAHSEPAPAQSGPGVALLRAS